MLCWCLGYVSSTVMNASAYCFQVFGTVIIQTLSITVYMFYCLRLWLFPMFSLQEPETVILKVSYWKYHSEIISIPKHVILVDLSTYIYSSPFYYRKYTFYTYGKSSVSGHWLLSTNWEFVVWNEVTLTVSSIPIRRFIRCAVV